MSHVASLRFAGRLRRRPPVGATLHVGWSVLMTESEQIAGGGWLVSAERIDESDGR